MPQTTYTVTVWLNATTYQFSADTREAVAVQMAKLAKTRNLLQEVEVSKDDARLGRVVFAPYLDLPCWQAFVPDGCDDLPLWFHHAADALEHLEGKAEDRVRAYNRRTFAHSY